MRKIIVIGAALMMVLMGLFVFAPSVAATEVTYVTDLIADGGDGYGIDVGDVTITTDETTLSVTYETFNGWVITGTHLHVADGDISGIPQTKKNNPIPGQFEYGDSFDPGVTSITYNNIDISGYVNEPVIAAHANVVHITEECLDIASDANVEWLDPYDTSGPTWKSTIPCYVHPSWPSISGATWIWRTQYTDPAWEYSNVPQYSTDPVKYGWLFKRDFNLPDGAYDISGSIDITADNGYELSVSGNPIGGDGSMHINGPDYKEWSTIETYDITSAITSGTNTISVRALNWFSGGSSSSNPAGFTFKAHTCYKYVDQEESAWAAGEGFPGKNWATYFLCDGEWRCPGIVSTSDHIEILYDVPTNILVGELESSQYARVWKEFQGELPVDLYYDLEEERNARIDGPPIEDLYIRAGTPVCIFYIHFDGDGGSAISYSDLSITFGAEILGVIISGGNLGTFSGRDLMFDADTQIGNSGTTYPPKTGDDYWRGYDVNYGINIDDVEFNDATVEFDTFVSNADDSMRVIVPMIWVY
jgi:hypothetical protein